MSRESSGADAIVFYLIIPGDAGESGPAVGCDDSAVGVATSLIPTGDVELGECEVEILRQATSESAEVIRMAGKLNRHGNFGEIREGWVADLLLHNGDAESSPITRANLAEVWLNGEQLVGRGNFLPVTRDLEIPVVLAASNELSVLVKGGVGRYLTLEILSLPVADAGPDQAATVGDFVTLDAGGSSSGSSTPVGGWTPGAGWAAAGGGTWAASTAMAAARPRSGGTRSRAAPPASTT